MHAPKQERLSRKERHIAAAIALADVDDADDIDWQLTLDRFRKSAENFVLELLGRRGAKASNESRTPEQRAEQAKRAAEVRWKKTVHPLKNAHRRASRSRFAETVTGHAQADLHVEKREGSVRQGQRGAKDGVQGWRERKSRRSAEDSEAAPREGARVRGGRARRAQRGRGGRGREAERSRLRGDRDPRPRGPASGDRDQGDDQS